MSEVKQELKMQKGAITFLDVLGWKGIWQRDINAHHNLLEMINTLKDIVKNQQEELNRLKHITEKLDTKIISISDTIAITTQGEYNKVLEEHAIITNVLISGCLEDEIFLRGATSFGAFDVKENIIIGPAVDEVASWYEYSEWIGAFYTPSATNNIDINKFNNPDNIILYPVPLKKYGTFKTYCNNWIDCWSGNINGIRDTKSRNDLKNILFKSMPLIPEIAIKYQNTLDFYDYYINKTGK